MRLPRPDISKCEEYGYEYERQPLTLTEKELIAAILGLCAVAMLTALFLPVRWPF